MRRAYLLAALVGACATAPAAPQISDPPKPAEAALVLKRVEARVGLPEPEVIALVNQNLRSLEDCTAFTEEDDLGQLHRLESLAALDDRVKVTLEVERYGQPEDATRLRVKTESVLSNSECVSQMIGEWPWPPELLEAMRKLRGSEPAVSLEYSFRPSEAKRTAQLQANEQGVRLVCEAFTGFRESESLNERIQPLIPQLSKRLQLHVGSMLQGLRHTSERDRPAIFSRAVLRIADSLAVHIACNPLRLVRATVADLVALDEAPTEPSCSARVAQMKSMKAPAATGLMAFLPDLTAKTGQPIVDDAFWVPSDRYSSVFAEAFDVARLAKSEAKRQGRAKPIVYLAFSSVHSVGDLVNAAKQWGVAFETRLLVSPAPGPEGELSKSAWAEALTLLRASAGSSLGASTASLLAEQFASEAQLCSDIPVAYNSLAHVAPADKPVLLSKFVAEALEACGCPQTYSQVAWARLALIFDALAAQPKFLPLKLSSKSRFVMRVSRAADAQTFVTALDQAQASDIDVVWSSDAP